jgi:hypothetical protein
VTARARLLETLFHWDVVRRRRSLHQWRARYKRLPRYRLTFAGKVRNFIIKIVLHEINCTGQSGLRLGVDTTRCSLSRGQVCQSRPATLTDPAPGVWRLP